MKRSTMKKINGRVRPRTSERRPSRKRAWKYAPLSADPIRDFGIGDAEPPELSMRKEAGDEGVVSFLSRATRCRVPTRKENWELAWRFRVHRDERALHALVLANLPLVVTIAKEFEGLGLSFSDLFQEGAIGLVKGAERFDDRYQTTLATFGSWWIKQRIKRALGNQSHTIRMPLHAAQEARLVLQTAERLSGELGREPSADEVADMLGCAASRVLFFLSKLPLLHTRSLDAALRGNGEDDERVLANRIRDPNAPDPSEETSGRELSERMKRVLAELSEREREILKCRFGFEGGEAQTLERIGKKYGVTRERVRQLEAKALQTLRRERFRRFLLGYTDSCSLSEVPNKRRNGHVVGSFF